MFDVRICSCLTAVASMISLISVVNRRPARGGGSSLRGTLLVMARAGRRRAGPWSAVVGEVLDLKDAQVVGAAGDPVAGAQPDDLGGQSTASPSAATDATPKSRAAAHRAGCSGPDRYRAL